MTTTFYDLEGLQIRCGYQGCQSNATRIAFHAGDISGIFVENIVTMACDSHSEVGCERSDAVYPPITMFNTISPVRKQKVDPPVRGFKDMRSNPLFIFSEQWGRYSHFAVKDEQER